MQICFEFFVKAVAELSDLTVEKEFKAISKHPVKIWYSFFDFIYIYIYIYKKASNRADMEKVG